MVLSRSRTSVNYYLVPDWDKTLGVYRVDPEIMQRHFLNFRSEIKTENGPSRTISVLFWYEILPDYKENDLESNEVSYNIG